MAENFFYVFFHSEAHSVRGIYFHSAALDARIVEARRSNDSEHRTDIYRQLNEMVVREAPLATLFHERFFVLQKPEDRP